MSPGSDPYAAHALFLPGEPARFGRFALWGGGIEDGEELRLFRLCGEHTAAACNGTAAAIETDPFTLLLLRGRSKEQLLDALREHRSTTAPTFPPDGRLATAAYRAAYGPCRPFHRSSRTWGILSPLRHRSPTRPPSPA